MQVTFIEALDQLMPGFDPEISKLAQRVLINPRNIDYYTGVFATKVVCYAIWYVTNGFLLKNKGSHCFLSHAFCRLLQERMESQS